MALACHPPGGWLYPVILSEVEGSNTIEMKKLLFILAALTMIIATGCNKEEKKIDFKTAIVGEWHCAPDDMEVDIYVEFKAEGDFALYQQLGEGRYRKYTGSWACEGAVLSGTYADGAPWGSSYQLDMNADILTMTALNESKEVINYIKEAIPKEVREDCIEVKSGGTL
jgi:uncharacterized protein (TIGR03066 family)